ncbi:ABC transporter substrate-binding protein [Micromonospora echinofusca]|uniref:Peptide/nickel transport system substrate-binding protein n=1 Tax=Micromonospora echinofusca TaxID=47858 RepID=A0A1C5G8V7_MICEH|nr:ABC transporter substrate-binding protein [Micromonospora echinofusca]SCG16150.1 peptide/nickel transport system substrate-binding protein [Micromonospora echinofusca]
MRTRVLTKVLAVGVISALAAGCGGGEPPSKNSGSSSNDGLSGNVRLQDESQPAGTPKSGGRLRVMIRLDANELDPHRMSETSAFVINEQIYESLVQSYRGEIKPAIAESWTQSTDGLSVTFKLRDNAVFHSGRKVTAADVKYSIERIKDPATRAPRARSYEGITSVTAVDERTVEMKLAKPNAAILTLLSTAASSIVDRSVAEAGGLNGSVDGGSGPFKIASRVTGQAIKLDKHAQYWEPGVPYLDGMDFTFNPDDNARAAAVRSGTVDFLWRPAPEFIDALKRDEKLKWYGGSGSLSLHLRLNTSKAPYDNVKVRQAIFLALDRQEILNVANSGFGTALNAGYLPPDRFGAVQEPIYGKADIEKAKALLAEAGYPNGFEAKLMVIATSAFQVRSAEVEQQQLAKIGIKVTIESVESTIADTKTKSADFDMYQSGFGLTYDPDERFTASFLSGGGLNYGNWTDQEYENLVVQARSEMDKDKRAALYQQAEKILAERGPVAMTFLNADFDVVQKDVMGYQGDPTPTYRFYRHIWLDR